MSAREIISPSLLARVETLDSSKTSKQFSLGMSDWTGSDHEGSDKENEDFQPEKKIPRKSFSLKLPMKTACAARDRFAKSLPDDEYAKMTKRVVPKNTKKNTSWAVRNFHEWREQPNKRHPTEHCRADILDSTPWDPEELKKWLCRFATETRRADGNKYPAHTLYQLLSGLLRYMREIDPDCPNFTVVGSYMPCLITCHANFVKKALKPKLSMLP